MIIAKVNSLERKIKRLVPSLFKTIIVKILTNKFFGKVIKIINPKKNLFGGVFDYKNVSHKEAAEIFFGFWESSEIRFAMQYAKSNTIIELGSSVGVMLGVLANKRQNTNFICVEASPINFKKLLKLKKILPDNFNNYELINKAVHYGSDHVKFKHLSTKGSRTVTDKTSKNTIQLPSITLNAIINDYEINENFTLISDIEGDEASIFFKDSIALNLCKNIIAEIDNSPIATAEEQISELQKIGFSIAEQYGRVYVFTKT